MSTQNPQHASCPPDSIVAKVTLNLEMDPETMIWSIYCPEWGRCELHDRNLTRSVAILLAEIETHNEEIIQGEPDWSKDPKKMWEAAYAEIDHETLQKEKREKVQLAARKEITRRMDALQAKLQRTKPL